MTEGVSAGGVSRRPLPQVAPGSKDLRPPTPEGQAGKAGRHKSKSPPTPPHRRLTFVVVGALPRLEAELAGLPGQLHEGELAKCTLRLRNAAADGFGLKGLKLCASRSVGRARWVRRENIPALPASDGSV
eukprot:518890-Prorocentrum_minimum.AAC.1